MKSTLINERVLGSRGSAAGDLRDSESKLEGAASPKLTSQTRRPVGAAFKLLRFQPAPVPSNIGRKREKSHRSLLWLSGPIFAVLTLSTALLGQASRYSEAAAPAIADWSNHHVIFSRPSTAEQAERVEQDPRYRQQIGRQLPAVDADRVEIDPVGGSEWRNRRRVSRPGKDQELNTDWSENMGIGATVGAGNYAAKYSFDGTKANCVADFVVYSTGLAGSSTQASLVAYNNVYSACNELNLGTAANFAMLASSTITSTGASVVSGGNIGISPGTSLTGFPPGVLTAPAVEHLGDAVAAQAEADANTAYIFYKGLTGAALIAPVLDGLTFTPGLYNAAVTLTLNAGQTVTLNGSGTYIFQIGSTLEIAGTVVLSGGATAGNVIWLVGSSATIDATAVAVGDILADASITLDPGASITGRAIALTAAVTMIDNSVTTVDTVPSVYWAYDTFATVVTSPAFSFDGTGLIVTQQNAVGHGIVLLLKWESSATEAIIAPGRPRNVRPALFTTCTAPCKTLFFLEDLGVPAGDTASSVFYDYGHDAAYVGDDLGYLHKFNPVFEGAPAEVTTGGWPVKMNPAAPTALTSPVHDSATGNVFVEDLGGFLYRVNSSTAAVTQSGQLDFSGEHDSGPGLVQGPVVDSVAGVVYVFATSDGSESCPGRADCTAVYRFTTRFAAGTTGSEVKVGNSSTQPTAPSPMYIGAFDSTYRNSTNATGHLYVCGNTGGDPTIYQISIRDGVLGTVTPGPALATGTTPCSPVTDVFNPNVTGGATEWVFASAEADGNSSGCSGGCIFNFKDTPWEPSNLYTLGQEVLDSNLHIEVVELGGLSGITAPFWDGTTGGTTLTDGTLIWMDQGPATVVTPAAWAANTKYLEGALILDINGNAELVTASPASGGSTSGTARPTFSTIPGGPTGDGTTGLVWTNVGAIATANLPAAGGTSGIIIDNTVGAATEGGASQVYFSTLSNQTCGISTTSGGCAVQVSQSALH